MISGDPTKSTAVYACARSIAFTIARLQAHTLTISDSGKKQKTTRSELLDCFNRTPNRHQDAFNFKVILLSNLVLRGNAFAIIGRDKYTKKLELTAVSSDLMTVTAFKNEDGFYFPVYRFNGEIIPSDSVLHILSFPDYTGVIGLSAIQNFRKTIGIGLQAENYGFNFFKNNASPGAVIKYPAGVKVDKEVKNGLLGEWTRIFAGSDNASKVALLADGATFEKFSMSNEDSQFIQTREFQIRDIARIFGVPPHKIGDLSASTYSNIEHQNLDYIQDAIMPYVEMMEIAIENKFFNDPSEQFEFDLSHLLRGDTQARTSSYIAGTQNGWLTPNEVRQMEGGLEPYEGGDAFYRPMNLGKVATDGSMTPPKPEPGPESENSQSVPEETEEKEG